MQLSEIFAENLKNMRKKARLTQKELGEMLGYTEKAISKWESGSTVPPAETLVALSGILHTSIDGLLSHKKLPEYFLGIDGGATKTLFALADKSGKIIRTKCLGPCNPVDIGFENSKAILSEGIAFAAGDVHNSDISMFAGISGGNAGENEKKLSEFFESFRFASFGVGNDAMNIIAAGLGENDGIAVIMGTGCVAFSKVSEKLTQYGGFGYLFDNGGDGYNIGRDAIHAALYDETGGGCHTEITKLLYKRNGCSSDEFLAKYYEKGKSYIASFSKEVFEAYDRGDAVAEKILYKNMAEIANLVDTALGDFDKKPVKTVFVGGLTKRSDVLFKFIREQMKHKDDVEMSVYPFEPVLGALKLAGASVNTESDNGITRE